MVEELVAPLPPTLRLVQPLHLVLSYPPVVALDQHLEFLPVLVEQALVEQQGFPAEQVAVA